MKKIAVLALVLVALMSVAACGAADPTNNGDGIRVAAGMPSYPTYPTPTLPGKYKVVPCPTHKHKKAVTLRACLRRV